jgi:hypothetical protein
MRNELGRYAHICAGHPFRGTVPEARNGTVIVVQMRDINPLDGVAWKQAVRTNLLGRKQPDWLQIGDILFVARGTRNFAVCVEEVPGQAVCSQYFFLIRLRDPNTLLPEFLTWQINQLPAQQYLSKNAEGTDQRSIRRGVLEALPVTVPPLEEQRQLVRLAGMARHERKLMEGLILNREKQMQALVLKLLAVN